MRCSAPTCRAPWTHKGYEVGRLVGVMYMTLEGIFGVAVDVSSSLIILFTIFGAFLQYSGAGKFYIDFSFSAMGGKPTGAGRTVVLALVPARRAVGLGRGDHGDAGLGGLPDAGRRSGYEQATPPAACWPRAAWARSSRRRCWARPPS